MSCILFLLNLSKHECWVCTEVGWYRLSSFDDRTGMRSIIWLTEPYTDLWYDIWEWYPWRCFLIIFNIIVVVIIEEATSIGGSIKYVWQNCYSYQYIQIIIIGKIIFILMHQTFGEPRQCNAKVSVPENFWKILNSPK